MQKATETAWHELQVRHYGSYDFACSKTDAGARETRGGTRHERIVEQTHQYVRGLFNDLLIVEYDALRKRAVSGWRKRYFKDLTSQMMGKIQTEFWRALNEQFAIAPCTNDEIGQYRYPRRDPALWEMIDSHIAALNASVRDSIDLVREALKEDAVRSIRASVPMFLIGAIIPVTVFLIGIVLLKGLASH